MKILITGGSGFVGRGLAPFLTGRGHEVSLVTRSIGGRQPPKDASWVEGDPTRPGPWQEEVSSADAVVNLAGESIFKRWSPKVKQRIVESRVLTTRNVVEALTSASSKDKVLLSTSAVGFYGPRGDEDLDESATPGHDFLASVTQEWEAEALEAEKAGVRVVLMRLGIVLAPSGGALGRMLPLFRLGLGGRLGHGRQWFSWIHRTDLVRAALFLLEKPEAQGPFNVSAPHPARNLELTRALGRALHRPAILPVPGFAIRLVMGEFGSVLLEGQKVLPQKLLELGFGFKFINIDQALDDLLS